MKTVQKIQRHKIIEVVSVLPPWFCWQLISWSYCATSRRFGLMAWRNSKKKVTFWGKRRKLRCYD